MNYSRWQGTDEGRRPSRESLQPTVFELIQKHGKDPLMALAMTKDELEKHLSRIPMAMLYVLHDVLVDMDEEIEKLSD